MVSNGPYIFFLGLIGLRGKFLTNLPLRGLEKINLPNYKNDKTIENLGDFNSVDRVG